MPAFLRIEICKRVSSYDLSVEFHPHDFLLSRFGMLILDEVSNERESNI
jgi:hypothetical protein